MSFIKSLRKKLPDVQVIGRPATGPRFFYDEIPIMSLGIAQHPPKSALWMDEFVNQRCHPSWNLNPWHVPIPRVKSNFGDIMRARFLDEYASYLYRGGQATYMDTEHIHRPYRRPLDITPEFLKMKDYLNPDCYPDYDEYDYIWVRYPVFPQVKGLPKCSTSPLPTSISNLWKLKNKMR